MKNIFKSMGVRVLAPMLCTVASLGLIVSILATVLLAAAGGSEKLYKSIYKEIAQGYALYAVESIEEGNITELESYFGKRGISCTITRQTFLEDALKSEALVHVFSYGEIQEESVYTEEFVAGAYYEYNINSLMAALLSKNYVSSNWNTVYEPVLRVVFDTDSGFFYYETDQHFYKVDDIKVYQSGSYVDYILTEVKGVECYYNGYYDIKLNTNMYQSWDEVAIDGYRMPLLEDERIHDVIQIVSEVNIQEKGLGGFVVEADMNYVLCYPDEYVDRYIVQVDWDETAVAVEESLFTEWYRLHADIIQFEQTVIPCIILSFLLLIPSFVLLVYSAKNEKEQLGILHKVPVATYTGGLAFAEFGMLYLVLDLIPMLLVKYGKNSVELGLVLWGIMASVMMWLGFIWIQNIVTRIKCRCFWRTSEVYYIYLLLKKSWKFISKSMKWCLGIVIMPFRTINKGCRNALHAMGKNVPLFWGGIAVFAVLTFLNFILAINAWWHEGLFMIFYWVLLLGEGVVFVWLLYQVQQLHEGSKRIAAGDLANPVDTSKLFWKFKEHGQNINKVSEGIQLAVNERMKSEHFKTELITNVSHDIKTPLTSIINYVDLIKKEELQDEKVQSYVDVLDRQSARLKKLIEDLMEASKASTGNLTVNLEECDIEVLLTQVIGEFEERLQKNQLEVVVDKPDHPVKMMADGRHMWRVLDNLLNNTCKYSLPGSRVYVSLQQNTTEAVIVFKNISKTALNIPSEELMERFVRGDSSRNTEGSGLGLSIAQSLTELMQGNMKLEIDGDLFKVTLRFPTLTLNKK